MPIRVAFSDRDPVRYLLVLAFVPVGDVADLPPGAPIARVRTPAGDEVVLIDTLEAGMIGDALGWIAGGQVPDAAIVMERTDQGEGIAAPRFDRRIAPVDAAGSNEVVLAEDVAIKFLRRLNDGIDPEWELGAALTSQGFAHAPAVLGRLVYRHPDHGPMTIAVLQRQVPNAGHAWDAASRFLDDWLDRAAREPVVLPRSPEPTAAAIMAAIDERPPEAVAEDLAPSLERFRLIGRRVAELHHALATVPSGPAFSPEPYTSYDLRSLYQSMRGLTARAGRSLRRALPDLEGREQELAEAVIASEQELYDRFRIISGVARGGSRIRAHGDLHLGQVLLAGDDVVFVDFEGQPDRFLEERRLKVSPLRDVADLLQSIRLAGMEAPARHREIPERSVEEASAVDALADAWVLHASAALLGAYLEAAAGDALLPDATGDRDALLDAMLLERAVDEVWQALLHEPDRLAMPLERLARMLGGATERG